jgi:hypothetical protein
MSSNREVQYWAIIVAAGDKDRDAHDINVLKQVLVSHGWDIHNIKDIIEENATREAILDTPFEWLQTNSVEEDDVILFYFSMHGTQIEDQPPLDEPDHYDEYLIPYDYDFENKTNFILDEELSDRFNDVNSKNLVLIFEACCSGGMIDGDNDLQRTGRVILTSCAAGESSWPIFLRTRWLFPHYLMKGLGGSADYNGDAWVSIEEAYYYAKTPTIIRSFILASIFSLVPFVPHSFGAQHPQLYDGWPTQEDNTEELQLVHLAN